MRLLLLLLVLLAAPMLWAQTIPPRDGWVIINTTKDAGTLESDLKAAVSVNKMGIVTQAGPTSAARQRGITIPPNKVIGVFNNDFAVRILATSTAAMIEAPIRYYITGNADGTTTLSYKTPSHVFAPYFDEGGDTLKNLAAQLDSQFQSIADAATQ